MTHSVVVGIITNGEMRQEFVKSLLSAQQQGAEIIVHCAGPYLDAARNKVIDVWRKEYPDADWLIFVDDDMEFNYQDILRLTEHTDRPVNCGIYMNPFPNGLRPVVYKWTYDDRPEIMTESFVPFWLSELLDQPRDDYGLIHVAAAGTGCMAIHKSVREAMMEKFAFPMPWFDEQTINGVRLGEDLTFCARLASMQIPVTIDPTVRAGHVKYFKFHPDMVDDFIPNNRWATKLREENVNV